MIALNINGQKFFHQLITLDLHDQAACAFVARDISRISRHNVTDNLIDRIVSLLNHRVIHLIQDILDRDIRSRFHSEKLCVSDILIHFSHVPF